MTSEATRTGEPGAMRATEAPPGLAGTLRRRIFGISERETSVRHRGFRVDDAGIGERLERIGRAFVGGYHAALLRPQADRLARVLERVEASFRGFAYEGAAMGLAIQDALAPWTASRFDRFLEGPGAAHRYMVWIGAGWAWARVPGGVERRLRSRDPLLGRLAIDGYGFHEGYFRWRRAVRRREVPRGLSPEGRRVFDQGLGRSLWFVEGASPERVRETVSAFPEVRHEDLWSGVGLAATYAGGVGPEGLEALRLGAGRRRGALAQGAAFAAKARIEAGNLVPHVDAACAVFCGTSAAEAAAVTDRALERVRRDGPAEAYAGWRQHIRDHFSGEDGAA